MKRKKALHFIKQCAIGMLLGIAMIIPGFSGGVLAVSMGLYEPMLDALSNFFKQPKKNILFLLPLGIGAVISFFALTNVLDWAMSTIPEQIICLFVGMVAGGAPGLIKEANEKGFRWYYLISAAVGISLIFVLNYMEIVQPDIVADGKLTIWIGLLCGAIMSVGFIVPGISTSFIFMYMGVYDTVLSAAKNFDIGQLWPLGLGFVLMSIAIVRAVDWLFKRFRGIAYYGVIGLMVGLVALLLYPLARLEWVTLLNIAVLGLGVLIGWLLDTKLGVKKEA